jgi:hypothetical protein
VATIPIEYSAVSASAVVDAGSRYLNSKIIYYGEQRFVTFSTYVRTEYEPTGSENVMVITKGAEYRPDLVSYEYYGYPGNWWRILEVNGMKDIYEFKAGKTIILPSTEI